MLIVGFATEILIWVIQKAQHFFNTVLDLMRIHKKTDKWMRFSFFYCKFVSYAMGFVFAFIGSSIILPREINLTTHIGQWGNDYPINNFTFSILTIWQLTTINKMKFMWNSNKWQIWIDLPLRWWPVAVGSLSHTLFFINHILLTVIYCLMFTEIQ